MVYLDHNATTPVDERVLEAMLPCLKGTFGNPSSIYSLGREARAILDRSREQVAALVGAHPTQVIFTSGGTEANNAALKGFAIPRTGGTIAISAVEHASVVEVASALAGYGWKKRAIPVLDQGTLDLAALKSFAAEADLFSVMWANNETGVLQDIASVAEIARENKVVLHTDAVQAAGKIALDFASSGAHLMSISAHKLYGPKGVGALIVDKAIELEPLLHGGGQERGRRGGTENLAAIAGFGMAAELALSELDERARHMMSLRQQLEQQLALAVPDAVLFGQQAERLPNTVFFAVPGIESETLITALDQQGIAVSSGSACGSSHDEPSHVLKAMGVKAETARCVIRVGLGKDNSEQDIGNLVAVLRSQVEALKGLAAMSWA